MHINVLSSTAVFGQISFISIDYPEPMPMYRNQSSYYYELLPRGIVPFRFCCIALAKYELDKPTQKISM